MLLLHLYASHVVQPVLSPLTSYPHLHSFTTHLRFAPLPVYSARATFGSVACAVDVQSSTDWHFDASFGSGVYPPWHSAMHLNVLSSCNTY